MIRKIKHPKGRGERLAVKAKKASPPEGGRTRRFAPKIHSNASPVYKLLKEKEALDADPRGPNELHP